MSAWFSAVAGIGLMLLLGLMLLVIGLYATKILFSIMGWPRWPN